MKCHVKQTMSVQKTQIAPYAIYMHFFYIVFMNFFDFIYFFT